MKGAIVIAVALAALLMSACATQFTGSAPDDDSHMYVVGSKQIFFGWAPAIWRCPAKTSGECENVKVAD